MGEDDVLPALANIAFNDEMIISHSDGSRISRRGRGEHQPRREQGPTTNTATFRKICMSKLKNWDPWGRERSAQGALPLDPPLP